MKLFLQLVLLASADALNLPNVKSSTPCGVKAAAALGTAQAVVPAAANALDLPSLPSLPALPSLPSLPEAGSRESDLLIFLAQTTIQWGVPVAAVGALFLLVGPPGKSGPDAQNGSLPPALAKAPTAARAA